MNHELAPRNQDQNAALSRGPVEDLVDTILATLAKTTARTYLSDYRDFATWLNAPSPAAALNHLVGSGQADAHKIALRYRLDLESRGLSSGTIQRRIASLRSAVKVARLLGAVPWSLEVPGVRARSYRDTRGPGIDAWKLMLDRARDRSDRIRHGTAVRDLAIVRLLHDNALRRAELVRLDLVDLELDADPPAMWILGKGRRERERLTLPGPTADALRAWIAVRPGLTHGPVFTRLDAAAGDRQRITGEAVRRIVGRIARSAGITQTVRPHGLRHQAITEALDAGISAREVQRFSRHRKIDTVLIYDDNRSDLAGDVARKIAGG